MRSEIQEKYVTLLRSKVYTQGAQVMKNNSGCYCALGVLCELYRKETGHGEWKPGGDEGEEFYISGMPVGEYVLPYAVREWAGIEEADPFITLGSGEVSRISSLNDNQELSFEEIADIVEAQW